MADNWMLGETAALDDYIPNAPTNYLGNAATAVKDWWTQQPSWLDKARAENLKTTEAFQRGGMGEIARQLATDTTEAQDLASGFGGNIKGVRPPVVPGALAAISEYRPPFYSAVEQAVQGAKQNAAPGQQWAGFLRNQPGVKPEEVEALKLGKLFEQPGSVPKEAVLGEIAANKVNVGEVVLGGGVKHKFGTPEEQAAALQRRETAKIRLMDTDVGSPDYAARAIEFTESERALKDIVPGWGRAEGSGEFIKGGDTKFGQYTLPGGENYREMLLTLPDKGKSEYEAFMKTMSQKYGGELEFRQNATLAEDARMQELANADKQHFRSSHYEEPNILAHVRYNDRVIDGKKTLFVEEVQSDWHQKGKREGYKEPYKVSELSEVSAGDPVASDPSRFWYVRAPDNVFQIAKQHTPTFQGAVDYIVREKSRGGGTVPDAPFKTTWPELAMKRIIREAAEKGYDKVAWTPGSVQAARYPEQLRQHVDEIAWSSPGTPRSNPEGLRYVHAKPRAGGMDLVFTVNKDGMITEASASQAKGQHVEDIFGKDMSRQIMEKADGEIASKDFVIGAKGQQGFYDEILPATVNKLVKKHGGRVGTTNIDASAKDINGMTLKFDDPRRNTPAHVLDITPSLRAAAMKGFPLFSAGGVAATGAIGELARQDEYQ